MPAKECIQTRIVSASAVKRVLDFRFEDVQRKINTHKLLCSNHPYYRNVAKHLWREPQIIKFENSFHIWINMGYICERAHSAMSRVESRFRTLSYRLTFTITTSLCCYSFRAVFHKIGSRQHQVFYYW